MSSQSLKVIAGVDEAGRGPLAGPVVAAAVILDQAHTVEGLADSKQLSAKKRSMLFDTIIARSRSYGVGIASVAEIDQLNILQASLLAMRRALEALDETPGLVIVDGNHAPDMTMAFETVPKADQTFACVSAASILAKVTRDNIMADLHRHYPVYGFNRHQGYPTALHRQMLSLHGPCPAHRMTFAPVKKVLHSTAAF